MSSVANLAEAARGNGEQDAAPNTRELVTSIATVFCFQGFAMSINGIGAPFIAKSFNLGESGIATLFAWISISAIGALGLSRMIDRLGRRRMLLVSMAGTSVSALAAAVATNYAAFALCELALFAFIGATVSGGVVILAEELPIELRARGQSWGGLGLGLGGGLCLTLMPMVTSHHSWRWMLVLASVMGVVALRRAARGSSRKAADGNAPPRAERPRPAAFTLPNAIIVALTLPETRGLSLEAAAMEEAFEKSR